MLLAMRVRLPNRRAALTNPVVEGLNEVLEKAESCGNLEDALLNSAGAVSEQMGRANVPLLSAPFETLDAIANIFFNEKYDFGDSPFEAGKEALREWEGMLRVGF